MTADQLGIFAVAVVGFVVLALLRSLFRRIGRRVRQWARDPGGELAALELRGIRHDQVTRVGPHQVTEACLRCREVYRGLDLGVLAFRVDHR